MGILEIKRLSKHFNETKAVNNVSLTVNESEIICLLGPSGCGKTTLLRLIAGLENPDGGSVEFNGKLLTNTPPQQRGFGMMFQDLALFPHMDVFNNIAFGLRMQRSPNSNIVSRVELLLELVNMSDYAKRKIHELSGGEQQRVALARALAPSPRLLMLDEPLGALDRVLRDSLQDQIRQILKKVGVSAIYVTHDRDEAFAMADKLVFMNGGEIIQIGTPEKVFDTPINEYVARSLGLNNILRGTILSRGEYVKIETSIGTIHAKPSQIDGDIGNHILMLIENSGIELQSKQNKFNKGINISYGTITERSFRVGHNSIKININGNILACHSGRTSIKVGESVEVFINPWCIKTLETT